MKQYKPMENVLVDGEPGFISAIHPNGKGVYKGPQHAYYWVRTPQLDYIDIWTGKRTFNGRAVNFAEADKRLKERNNDK
ncbi:MAG: hypothetical protein KAS32_31000 [Candidatus Peribacteraceae bacterium]|nr:hypothetical protein [Candidatus Peribacteraceae bacterium]